MNHTREIVTAVSLLTIAGLVAIVVAATQGGTESALIIGSMIGLLAPTVTALLAFMKSSTNQDQLTQVEQKVDTATTAAGVAATAAGVAAAKTQQVVMETNALRVAKDNVDVSTESAVVIRPHEDVVQHG